MTKKQAIQEAKRQSKKSYFERELFVVYDVTYEEMYGKAEAYAICDAYDLGTFYSTETPIFSTGG